MYIYVLPMKIWKKMKKQTVEFVSLNVAYRLTEYDTESVTKDYNLPFFSLKNQFKSLCQIYIYKFIPP